MSVKRILLVSPFPPLIGGVSVSVQRLYDFLIKSGYCVVKFNTDIQSKIFKNSKTLKFFKYLSLPVFLMTHKHFDVIHFHVSGVYPKLYVTLWRSLFSGRTQFIVSIHGQISHILTTRFGNYSLKKFDKIICVRPGDSLNLSLNLKNKAVEISAFIPPSIPDNYTEKFPYSLQEFLQRDSFKLLVNGFIIVDQKFVDLYGFKDAVLLLEQLRSNGKNADLALIVLGFPYNDKCRTYIKNLKEYSKIKGLKDHIFWIEEVNMELWPLLKKVNVLLRPTKSDGDAISIRESLYLKIPVIASNAVQRPADTIVYDLNHENDFLNKAILLIDNYRKYVSKIGDNDVSFAERIVEQYETRMGIKHHQADAG